MDERLRSPDHICVYSGCCDYVAREPTHVAIDAIDDGLRSYEWFRDEGERVAAQATFKAGLMLVAVAILLTAAYMWLTQ